MLGSVSLGKLVGKLNTSPISGLSGIHPALQILQAYANILT
jgi:hypothetical protein